MNPELADAARQSSYDIRFEWGLQGLDAVAAGCRSVVVVDVLRFSTAVTVAVGRGAAVLPSTSPSSTAAIVHAARWPRGASAMRGRTVVGETMPCCGHRGGRTLGGWFAAFGSVRDGLDAALSASVSGRELGARGYADDVAMAAALDAETVVPVLDGPAFVAR